MRMALRGRADRRILAAGAGVGIGAEAPVGAAGRRVQVVPVFDAVAVSAAGDRQRFLPALVGGERMLGLAAGASCGISAARRQ